jgi:hypothetical protein
MANMIEFTDDQLDKILALQEQEGFETVQDAVICAVDSFLKEDA